MNAVFYIVPGDLGRMEHQFLWSPHRVLLHLCRGRRGSWELVNWIDVATGREPVEVMHLMGQTARRMTARERFLFWLYERGWRDEPI